MAYRQGYFNQGFGGYDQQMQPMYQPQAYPMPQNQQNADQPLFCRRATNRDEVRAYPVDFNGQPMTFLGPGLQTIWLKSFNPGTGGSDVVEYRPVQPTETAAPKSTETVLMPDFQRLENTVQKMGETLQGLCDDFDRLRNQRRRANREQEVTDDA